LLPLPPPPAATSCCGRGFASCAPGALVSPAAPASRALRPAAAAFLAQPFPRRGCRWASGRGRPCCSHASAAKPPPAWSPRLNEACAPPASAK
jgi:hypothetical protein